MNVCLARAFKKGKSLRNMDDMAILVIDCAYSALIISVVSQVVQPSLLMMTA